jgi:hypothetical protein
LIENERQREIITRAYAAVAVVLAITTFGLVIIWSVTTSRALLDMSNRPCIDHPSTVTTQPTPTAPEVTR